MSKPAAATNFETALARLDDYVRGQDDEPGSAAYEEELFGRALEGDAPELAFHTGLGATLRHMNSRGTLDIWLTARDVERVRASGLKAVILEYHPDDHAPLDLPPDTDLMIMRVPIPLEGVRSLEAEVYASDGRLLKRMPDIHFEPADGAVFACCDADLARTASSVPLTLTKVWAVTDTGRRLLIELPGSST
ncbi:MAG TPA: hypothetical protein VGK73_27740 [Polyangiaceae bacterium]